MLQYVLQYVLQCVCIQIEYHLTDTCLVRQTQERSARQRPNPILSRQFMAASQQGRQHADSIEILEGLPHPSASAIGHCYIPV